MRVSIIAVLALTSSWLGADTAITVDLAQIGHIASNGRVQDEEYNPCNRVVGELIAAGPDAITFLVAKIADESEVSGPVLDFWPRVRVGDVALVVLNDLFTLPDGVSTTIPGLGWDMVLERGTSDTPAWDLLERYLAAHGRKGLQRRVQQALAPYRGQFTWDKAEGCFRPAAAEPPHAGDGGRVGS